MSVLLDVQELQTRFQVRKGYVYAVNGVSFTLEEGETLAVVGESGCGKSVTMLSLVRLLPPAASIENGKVLLRGEDLLELNLRQLRDVRGGEIGATYVYIRIYLYTFRDICRHFAARTRASESSNDEYPMTFVTKAICGSGVLFRQGPRIENPLRLRCSSPPFS